MTGEWSGAAPSCRSTALLESPAKLPAHSKYLFSLPGAIPGRQDAVPPTQPGPYRCRRGEVCSDT